MAFKNEKEQEALQLLVEILQESVFDQEKMIRDILKQRIISLKQAITMSGHSLSMKKVLSALLLLAKLLNLNNHIFYLLINFKEVIV